MNTDVKNKMKEKGVFQWQVAEALNISEWQFSRYLRHELPSDMKKLVLEAIEKMEVNKNG